MSAIQALADTLSSSNVIANHPGGVRVAGDLYPQNASVTNEVGKRSNYYGRLRISANSLSGGSQITFQIPPASLVGCCLLNGYVSVPQYVYANSAWMYDMIDSVQYSLGGSSSVNNISLSGKSNFDLVMASCASKEKRNNLMKTSIQGVASNYYGSAVIWLPWSAPNLSSVFPYDTASLKSNIQITIQLKPFWKVFNGITGQSPTLPTSFNSLNMSCFQSDVVNPALSIGYQMQQNPSQDYKFPFHLSQTFQTTQAVVPGTPFTVQLSSLPAGILEAIVVSISPLSSVGVIAGTTAARSLVSYTLSSYSLLFNGQTLIDVQSDPEFLTYSNILMNEGDGLEYTVGTQLAYGAGTQSNFNCRCYILPMSRDIQRSLNDNYHENTPSFGGSLLNFVGNVSTLQPDGVTSSPSEVYQFNFTYLFSSIIDNQMFTTSIISN
jgi:hypothetical protein